jgi:hypothetical protein
MATALQTTGPTTSRTPASAPQLSSTLNAIVEADLSVSEMAPLPAHLRDEGRRAIAALEAANQPSDPAEVGRMLGKLALLFPNAKLSNAEAEAQNALYVELLSDIPQSILSGAFRKCAQTSRFFPAVSEIRDAAQHELSKRSWMLMRLKALVAKEPADAPIVIVTPEEREAIKQEFGLSAAAAAMVDKATGKN